jgi:FixJ family two-component response regulator
LSSADPIVYVVDDHPGVRRSLARLLRSSGHAVAEYASAADFLAEQRLDRIGCIVLDVNMPEMSGPQLQVLLAEQDVLLAIVFLTADLDLLTGIKAMKAGAIDYLLKPVEDDMLLAAIDRGLDWSAARHAEREQLQKLDTRLRALSKREHEVMRHVIGGYLNKQIAMHLGIAEKTVKVHRGQVMRKLEVDSVAELVRLCAAGGVAPWAPGCSEA